MELKELGIVGRSDGDRASRQEEGWQLVLIVWIVRQNPVRGFYMAPGLLAVAERWPVERGVHAEWLEEARAHQGFPGFPGDALGHRRGDRIPAVRVEARGPRRDGGLVAQCPQREFAPLFRGRSGEGTHLAEFRAFVVGVRGKPGVMGDQVGEVEELASLFKGAFGEEAIVLRRDQATKGALCDLVPVARFIHVATHGYFSEDAFRTLSGRQNQSGLGPNLSLGQVVTGLAPSTLCGLALAGANRGTDLKGRVPGIVTAEELAGTDMSGCELAVLSACETHLGIHRAAQGLASLQQALHTAGARSVITSLWDVPDEATKDLMIDFYRRIWVEKKPKWQALWEARMKIRSEKDASGRPKYKTSDWAAWVLTGDPN